MVEPQQLQIHSKINSRYQVFDRSGRLPFTIVFGLRRRSAADTDPRPLALHTARSALDVPYALKHKLLVLHEDLPGNAGSLEVDVGGITDNECDDGTYISLASPVDRTESKLEGFTSYEYPVDANSELASILEPNKKYTFRLASRDLGVKWHAYGALSELLDSEGRPKQPSGEAKLVNGKDTAGRATFRVFASIPWPPRVVTRMRMCPNLPSSDASQTQPSSTVLEVSITNEGDRAASVQSRGRQRFLVPWGPFQPQEETDDTRTQVFDTESSGISNLEVINTSTGEVVRGAAKKGACDLYNPTGDARPRLSSLVTLAPDQPIFKHIDISKVLTKLPDGLYSVRLQPRSAWWCFGTPSEISEGADDRVSRSLYRAPTPPILLECGDTVVVQVQHGKCSPVLSA